MKNLLIGASTCALLLSSMVVMAQQRATTPAEAPNYASDYGETVATSSQAVAKSQNAPKSQEGADPVKYKAEDGISYDAGAGDKAAKADMALSVASAAMGPLIAILKEMRVNTEFVEKWITSNGVSASMGEGYFVVFDYWWFPIYFSFNPFATLIEMGHAAVNKYMRDATYITADFAGPAGRGHVTDKWVGPPDKNTTVAILGEFKVPTQRFDAVAFNEDEYKGMDVDVNDASALDLMNFRNKHVIEEQRSLDNVTDTTWGVRYRAQQRAITALVTALQVKEELAVLAEADTRISPDYTNKTSAVSTVASRRVLYDALMFLKMNVMAARAKMRAETMELDFKPVTKDPVGEEEQ